MKKIYSLMLALFATLCVGTAYAASISFTVNVDNPEAVTLEADWKEVSLVAGDNVITVTEQGSGEYAYYAAVYLYLNEGFGLQNITSSSEDVETFTKQGAGVYALYPDNTCADITYTVTTFAYADMRTDSVIVLIDDKSKATMAYGNGQGIVLDSTFNVVYFSTEESIADLPLIVRAAGWGTYLYEVTLNDSVITDFGRGYQMNEVKSGDTIQISANAPAGFELPVIFQWEDGADKDAFDSLYVDGKKVDYKDTIKVAWGKEVKMWLNTKNYLVKINGSKISSSYNSEVILDTTVWEIESAKYEDFDVTIIAHNPGCISVQKSIDYTYPTLVEGENTISMNTSNTYIYIRKTDDCVIDSVKVNGELLDNYSAVECAKNMVIEIWGDSIHRDQTFALYVDTIANYDYTIRTAAYKYLGYYYSGPFLTDGYSTIAFADADNPINFSVGYSKSAVCYLNDSIVTLSWGSCSLKLANNDVVKIFADTAKVYTVTLKKGEKAIVKGVTKDRVWALNVDTTSFTVLQGTEVTVTVPTNMVLTGGDDELSGENGVYTITVNSDTTINITATNATNCAEANAAADGTVAVLGEFVVAYVNGDYTYIQDETGSALIFKKGGFGLNAGDVVTGFKGEVDIFNNLPELVPSVTLEDLTVTAGEAPAPAVHTETLTLEDVNKYIKLEGVTAVGTFTSDNKTTIKGEWNGEPLNMYNQFKIAQEFKEGVTYDVVCAVSVYKTTLQVNFISAEALSTNVENAVTSNKAEKFVRDGQLIIRMNGVEYNVLGAKLQ